MLPSDEMTPKERMRIVLEGGKADRIPIALCSDADYQCKAAEIDHREFRYGDSRRRAEAQRRFYERHPANDLLTAWTGVPRDAESWDLTREGDRYFATDPETGERFEVEQWDTACNPNHPRTSEGIEEPVTCSQDIPRIVGSLTPDDIEAWGIHDQLAILAEEIGDHASLGFYSGSIFPPAVRYLGGFERAMELLATDPSLVREVVEAVARRNAQRIITAEEYDPDFVWVTGYLDGADMISPGHFREVIVPGYRILLPEAQRRDIKVLLWFLGDCMPLLEDIVELGVDGLVVEQPRRGYSSEPGEVRRRVGRDLCVFGWTPELPMISDDHQAISRVLERQVQEAGLNGAFVMGTTYLTAEVACETVDFVCDEVVRLSRGIDG